MFFSTVIEIIAAIFVVYGIYASVKTLLFMAVYERRIRKSISVAVTLECNDTEEDRRLKLMCAKQIASDMTPDKDIYIIENKEE